MWSWASYYNGQDELLLVPVSQKYRWWRSSLFPSPSKRFQYRDEPKRRIRDKRDERQKRRIVAQRPLQITQLLSMPSLEEVKGRNVKPREKKLPCKKLHKTPRSAHFWSRLHIGTQKPKIRNRRKARVIQEKLPASTPCRCRSCKSQCFWPFSCFSLPSPASSQPWSLRASSPPWISLPSAHLLSVPSQRQTNSPPKRKEKRKQN